MDNQEIKNENVNSTDFKAMYEELKKEIENLKNNNQTNQGKNNSLIAEVEKNNQEVRKIKEIENNIKKNLEFNNYMNNDFVNTSIFKDFAKDIINVANNRKYLDDTEKRFDIQKSICDEILTNEKFLNYLTPSLKNKALKYSNLSDIEKTKQSTEYFDLVKQIKEIYERDEKRDMVRAINRNSNLDFSQNKEYENKFRFNKKSN